MPAKAPSTRPLLAAIAAALLVAAGLALALGGAWLAVLGGSAYYAVAGVLLTVTGALLWRGRGAALGVYAALLAGTVGWALWKVGWQARLPADGQATPMSYRAADGRQYVVIAAGGHGGLGTRSGDYIVAFALPK